jgi:diphosphomevalonate decarboxylase
MFIGSSSTYPALKDFSGPIVWKSPSNIALIKYWGKKEYQLPQNPSLSMTLSNAHSEMALYWREGKERKIEFTFHQQPMPSMERRIEQYFQTIIPELPVLQNLQFKIESKNNFPHSAGIASSASSFSALALDLCSLEQHLSGKKGDFRQRASHLARLGSGSACRSIYGPLVLWGQVEGIPCSGDEWAVPLNDNQLASAWAAGKICDTILVADSSPKKVSSSEGHALMKNHPLATARYERARQRLAALMTALKKNDWPQIISLVEAEALEIHALMMMAATPYMLMRPQTLLMMEKIIQYREERGLPLCFSLDAGPNIHLLYPLEQKNDMALFIEKELKKFCDQDLIVDDCSGCGPQLLQGP